MVIVSSLGRSCSLKLVDIFRPVIAEGGKEERASGSGCLLSLPSSAAPVSLCFCPFYNTAKSFN